MVFPGRLSTGCHVCRRRKVKCDGDKPECRRCIQHGIQCTGYPDRFSFREYRPSRESAAIGSLRIQRSRQNSTNSRSDCPRSISSALEPKLSRALSICTDWQSICIFMHQVVLKVHRSPCQGHLAFLPEFLQEKGDEPCLRHALLSVSQLILSNMSASQELHVKARINYGRSLELLNKALGSREDAVKDETLATCLFLSMFLNYVNEGGGLPDPHVSGISHLLLLREQEQVRSRYTRDFFAWIITQIQIQGMGTNKSQHVKIPAFIRAMLNPDCVLRAGILNNLISEFCLSTPDMWDSGVGSSVDGRSMRPRILQYWLRRASYLIEEIEIWNASIPAHWKKQYQLEGTGFAAASAVSPPDPWTMNFLAITQTAQLVFYVQVLSCCRQAQWHFPGYSMPKFPGDIGQFCETVESQIIFLLRTICYTVSTQIGFLDASATFQPTSTATFAKSNTLLWPMATVVTCPFASTKQVALCRQALQYIGRALNHRLALSLSGRSY